MSANPNDLVGEAVAAGVDVVGRELTPSERALVEAAVEHATESIWQRLPARDRCFAAVFAALFGMMLGLASALGWVSFVWGTWGMALAGCAAAVLPSACPWIRSTLGGGP